MTRSTNAVQNGAEQAAKSKSKPHPPRYSVVVDPGLTTPAKAVSIWLAVLAHAKVPILADLDAMPDNLDLTEDQVAALRANAHILTLVGHRTPVVSLAICPECGRWTLCVEPTKSTCKMTLGCGGKPVRVPAAKRVKVAQVDTAAPEDEVGTAPKQESSNPASNKSGSGVINAPPTVRHPAKFSPSIMDLLAELIPAGSLVLDPFAGTGRIHEIGRRCGARTVGVEIEPEWASLTINTVVGDATCLPFPDDTFDVAATSCVYGNRLSDHHQARDGSVRHSYTHDLGRTLHRNNAGAMQWGDQYRALHRAAWAEVIRVMRPGGMLLLNVSDHVRKGVVQPVTAWHVRTLELLGFHVSEHHQVPTPRLRYGQNAGARVEFESVVVLKLLGGPS